MGLIVNLLGPPRVEVDGRPLVVDTRKATALLALLVVRAERVGRDAIATMLWPDAAPERARASLRRTLSSLMSGLGGRWVRTEGDTIAVDVTADDLSCDVHDLRASARVLRAHDTEHRGAASTCETCAPAASALGDVGARLLDGFSLRDAPGFDDWVQVEAEGLRRDAALILERQATRYLAVDDGERALATARRWLELDPLHERAHRAVMRAAAAAGRRDDAIRQYRRCVATLDHELGVAPLPETTALYTDLLGDRSSNPAAAPPPVAAPAGSGTRPFRQEARPLVDRDEELAALQQVLRDLAHGAACVAIEGEAGIGKTRIAEEFVEYAAGRGSRTVTVSCAENEAGLTCGPLTDLLRDAAAEDPSWTERLSPVVLAEVGRIVPELTRGHEVPPTASLESPGAQARFLDGLFTALAAVVAGPAPGVVVIDDLHWVDPTTLDVVCRGLRRHRDAPVLLVVAWRTELVGHDHPVRRLLREDAVTTLSPGRLTREEVLELVESIRRGDPALGDRLYEETEGIPFFVVQYLAALDEGGWELPGPVRDLVAARLAPLSDLARQCLTAGAVLGRSFDLSTLVRTSGRSEDEVVAALDELSARQLLREHSGRTVGEARYDFAHTKIRDVVEASASLARRRLLHRRAAEATLAATGGSAAAASRIAQHYRAAGDEPLAAEQHAVAGLHARSLFANVEALDHLETALALGHPDTVGLQLAVGDLHALSGRYADARASYAAAAAGATDGRQAAELEHRLGVLHLRWGAWVVAASHLETALGLLPEPTAADEVTCLHARIRADRAATFLRLGDAEAADREVARAVAEAGLCDDDQALAEAHNTAGLVARRSGRLETARDHLRAALHHAERLSDPGAHVAALNNLALVLGADGQVDEALTAAREALKRCNEIGDRHREAAIHSNVADLLHGAGRTDEALPHLTESARLLADVGGATRSEPEVWKLTDW